MKNGGIRNTDTTDDAVKNMARLQQEALLSRLRGKLKEFQATILDDVQSKVSCMIDELTNEMRLNGAHINEFKGLANHQQEVWANRLKIEQKDQSKKFSDKIFIARDSVCTCLYREPHIKTIYHIFVVMLMMLVLNTTVVDYVTEGQINFGQHTIQAGMAGFWRGIGIWCVMQVSVFVVYYGMKIWVDVRQQVKKYDKFRQLWDATCLILFVSFQFFFMTAFSYAAFHLDLAFVCKSSVLVEMTRFIMKTHAFVRTNVPRILDGKLKQDSEDNSPPAPTGYPTLSQFVYYLFAPTYIYRDNYPRTSRINWMFALCRLLEVIGAMFFIANIHERYIRTHFQHFGKEQITLGDLVEKLFGMILPGLLILFNVFYCVLHAWLNFTAEILQFADRLFYKDWWTVANYAAYYRNWNLVVHDWIYEYIYKDFYQYVFRGSKTASSLMIFMISALIHEYILGVGFKFFVPITIALFGGLGVIFFFLTRRFNQTAGNIFFWWSLSIGNSLMMSLYAIEYYARQNCPTDDHSWSSYFIPVSLSCNGIK